MSRSYPSPADAFLDQALERHVERQPEHPAFELNGKPTSYHDFSVLVGRLARGLSLKGFTPGEVVGMRLQTSVETAALAFAAVRIGCTFCPFSVASRTAHLVDAKDRAGIRCFVVDRVDQALPADCQLLLSALLADNPEQDEAGTAPRPDIAWRDDALIEISHSSGTTGTPKLFGFDHGFLRDRCARYLELFGWTPADRFCFNMDMGDPWGFELVLVMLVAGATVVLEDVTGHEQAVDDINHHEITVVVLLPWQLRIYLQLARPDAMLRPKVRQVITGASYLASEEKLRVLGSVSPHLIEIYGSTEVSVVSVATPGDIRSHPGSVGRVQDFVDLEVVDDQGRAMEPGTVGQVRVRRERMPTSYVEDAPATSRAFSAGYYYPGDVGMVIGDGYLELKGRTDDVIDNAGAKFYPFEVEEVLLGYPGVDQCVVIGWPDPVAGEVAAAVFVSEQPMDAAAIYDHCKRNLEPFKVPQVCLRIQALPMLGGAKVDYRRVQEMLRQALASRDT